MARWRARGRAGQAGGWARAREWRDESEVCARSISVSRMCGAAQYTLYSTSHHGSSPPSGSSRSASVCGGAAYCAGGGAFGDAVAVGGSEDEEVGLGGGAGSALLGDDGGALSALDFLPISRRLVAATWNAHDLARVIARKGSPSPSMGGAAALQR